MEEKVRRSWLIVPASNEARISQAHLAGSDVVVLDLAEGVADQDKPAARQRVASAIDQVKAGGAEVFVQVDPELLYADLRACVWPGLTGVIIARLESPSQISEAVELLDQLEGERGILPGSLEIVASLETAQGNQQAFDIATSSRRTWGLTLGRADLVMDLRPEPSGEIHLMQYLMQRLVIVAVAADRTPLGAWWRAPDRGLLATPDNTYQAAVRGRAIGFKGSFCLREDQVGPLNRGFTPAQEELDNAHLLLTTYNEVVARGGFDTLTVSPTDLHRTGDSGGQSDRIIDRGTAAQAQRLIHWSEICEARDQAKTAALEGRPLPAP